MTSEPDLARVTSLALMEHSCSWYYIVNPASLMFVNSRSCRKINAYLFDRGRRKHCSICFPTLNMFRRQRMHQRHILCRGRVTSLLLRLYVMYLEFLKQEEELLDSVMTTVILNDVTRSVSILKLGAKTLTDHPLS
jgi:hypothetical protein